METAKELRATTLQSVCALEEDVQSLNAKLSDASDEIARLRAQNAHHLLLTAAAAASTQQLEDTVCRYKADLDSLRQERDILLATAATLQRDVKLSEEARNISQSNYATARASIARLELDIEKLREAASQQAKENIPLSSELARLQAMLSALTKRLADAETNRDMRASDADSLKGQLVYITEDTERKMKALQELVDCLQREAKRLESENSLLFADGSSMNDRCNKADGELVRKQNELDLRNSELAQHGRDLRAKDDELTNLRAALSKASKELTTRTGEALDTRHEANVLMIDNDALKKELEASGLAVTGLRADLSSAQSMLCELQQRLGSLRDDNKMKDILSASVVSDLNSMQEQSRLQAELLLKASSEQSDLDLEMEALRRQLGLLSTATTSEISRLREALGEAEEALTTSKETVDMLTKDLALVRSVVADLESKLSKSDGATVALSKDLARVLRQIYPSMNVPLAGLLSQITHRPMRTSSYWIRSIIVWKAAIQDARAQCSLYMRS